VPDQGNWREVVIHAVEKADWDKVKADVEPFLEHSHDIETLSKENVLKLLRVNY
jgi:hypothetical protein